MQSTYFKGFGGFVERPLGRMGKWVNQKLQITKPQNHRTTILLIYRAPEQLNHILYIYTRPQNYRTTKPTEPQTNGNNATK